MTVWLSRDEQIALPEGGEAAESLNVGFRQGASRPTELGERRSAVHVEGRL